ncbi:MAG: siroheme synthase CysG [Acetobacter peroxydans]|nr:siroheme synthase CysG [Acetobacter peroxydans]MCI2077200.1 siroheme synthase CysG [Acetobacter peroxydans]
MQPTSDRTDWFPIVLRMEGARALVVGGGQVAANKTRLLVQTGAQVHVQSATLCDELAQIAAQQAERESAFTHIARDATPADAAQWAAQGFRLVYLATNDQALNHTLAALCQQHNLPVCAVDDPAVSSFITPALITRGPVQVAISTGGAAPVLARRLRTRIEQILPDGLGRLARFMQEQRSWLRARLPEAGARRQIWERFIDGPGGRLGMDGQTEDARKALDTLLEDPTPRGEVWLVGAGPGNPDLLSLAALRMMQDADVVLYDNLVAPTIMNYIRRDAELVFVGKSSNRHTLPQGDINAELVRRAKQGLRVLRLKGGDPFIFGRGGEEIETLAQADVPFRIIPGISAANGCAAYAGIPLTHRDCAQSCLFITGHARADGTLHLDWETIALHNQTVVIYMGLAALPQLCARLIEHGLPPDWPAALIERGTLPEQRVLCATLSDLAEKATEQGISSPALIVVGEVVRHRILPSGQ